MEKGDLSNRVAVSLLFVFDGLIGQVVGDRDGAEEAFWRRLKRWDRAARTWTINTLMVTHLWDLVWRSPFKIDLATFLEEPYAEAMERRLDKMSVPFGDFLVTTPDELAQRLAYMPHVSRVYHGNPDWVFKFGRRGELVTDPKVFKVT